jgi:predicted restriction endonuclease
MKIIMGSHLTNAASLSNDWGPPLIKPLGNPHDGPDKASNMLVLCPNHHLQFDRGVLRIRKVGTDYRIRSKAAGDPLDGKTITLKHALDDDCVKWHHNWFRSKRT